MSIPKLLLSFALPLLLSLPAAAQIGTVEGYVNGPDGKAAPNAVVNFDRIDYKLHYDVKTDKKGFFALYTILNGDYRLTITVDGQIRDKKDFFHVSPGRQNTVAGNSATLVFTLKAPEAMAAEQQKEVAKEATNTNKDQSDKNNKAREEAIQKQKALNDSYGAGKAALDAKQYDAAIENLTKAAEMDPKQGAVWSSLADAYMGVAHGQKTADAGPTYQKAYDAFAKAIEVAPTNAGNYNNFALALAANNKLDEAKQNLAKAIEIDPAGAGKYHYNLGALLMNVSQPDAAVEEFRKAIAADPNYAESYFYLGSTLAGKATVDASGKMQPPDGTIQALQRYLDLKPDGPNAPAAKDLLAALDTKIDVNYKDPNAKNSKKTK